MSHNRTFGLAAIATLAVVFQGCSSRFAAVTTEGSRALGPIVSNPPITMTNGIYVTSSLTADKTCSQAFSGVRPAGLSLPNFPSYGGASVQYQWDFTNSIVRDESTRYGYRPSYNPDRVSFAANGRPMIRDKNFHLQWLNDLGNWESIDMLALAKQSMAKQGVTDWPISAAGAYTTFTAEYADPSFSSEIRVVFDNACNAYAVINANRTLGYSILMHSPDGGHNWGAYPIPESAGGVTIVSMELPTRLHVLEQTPVLLIRQWYRYAGSPDSIKIVTPTLKDDGTLIMGAAHLAVQGTISEPSVGGAENSAISSGDNVYLVYPGSSLAVDSISGRHGVPQYAVTYSRSAQKVIAGPGLLGVAVSQTNESEVDEHNQPTIAIDKQKYLHVVLAGHNGPLYYRKSASPGDISTWSGIELIGQRAGAPGAVTDKYTYPSLVIDQYDEPVIVARWAGDSYIFKLISNTVGSSRVDLQACKLEYSIVSPK